MYLKFFKLIFTFVNFIKNAIMFDNMNTVYDVKIEGVTDNGEVIQTDLKIKKR